MTDVESILKRLEFQYRVLHQRQDLIGENTLTPDLFDELTGIVNSFVGDSGRRLGRLCRRYPATVATFLVHCSLYEYTARTANLWDGVWNRLDIGRSTSRQQLLGRTFLEYLQTEDLPRLEAAGRPYVGQMLMHTPIPLDSMPNFFEDVVQALAEQPELTVADLGDSAWPVQTFIEYGGRLAEDVIARSIDLYRHLLRVGRDGAAALAADDAGALDPVRGSGTPDDADGRQKSARQLADQFGLPPLLVRQMGAWFPTRPELDGTRGRRMQLRFDPYGAGIVLEVRRRGLGRDGARAAFGLLRVDGVEHQVDLAPDGGFYGFGEFGPGGGERIVIPAPGPGSRYELVVAGGHRTLLSRGVELEGPSYFDPRTGRRLGPGPLPAGDVWVLVPRGWTVAGGHSGGEAVGVATDGSAAIPSADGFGADAAADAAGVDAAPAGAPALTRSVVVEELPGTVGPWRKFEAFGLHTEGHTFLRWYDNTGLPVDLWERPVELHPAVLPKLSGGDEFTPWLMTTREGVVYRNRAPRLWLPVQPRQTQDLQRWSVHCERTVFDDGDEGGPDGEAFVSDPRGGPMGRHEVVFEYELSDLQSRLVPAEDGAELDLEADGLLGGEFGDFILTVLGPLGSDVHLRLTLARDVDVDLPFERIRPGERERGIGLFEVSGRGPTELTLRTRAAEVVTGGGGAGRGPMRGRRFAVRPDDDVAELLLRVSRPRPMADGEIVGGAEGAPTMDVASIPIRLKPAEWRLLNIDSMATTGSPAHPFGPISLHVSEVKDLQGRAIVFQSFLSEQCRHEFTMYADGQPLEPKHSWRRKVHSQRSRVDLATYAETLREYTGAHVELRATVKWSGGSLEYLLARIEFDWQVRDLETRLEKYSDGSGDFRFEAMWRDVYPPRRPRRLILEDRWRRRAAVELNVEGSALAVTADLTAEQLPPGRYTVDFVSRSGWSRDLKRPVRIEPATILDVDQDAWGGLLRNPQGVDGWLLALNASLDGAWGSVSPPESWDHWTPDQHKDLGWALAHRDILVRAADVVRDVRELPLERRLLVAAAADVEAEDFRRLAVMLGLPRSLAPSLAGEGAVPGERFSFWPALLSLAGLEPLPELPGSDERYLWGHLYTLQDPRRVTDRVEADAAFRARGSSVMAVTNGSRDVFGPERPAQLLVEWLRHPHRMERWRCYGRGLESAYGDLTKDVPTVMKIIEKLHPKRGRVLRRAQQHFFECFRIQDRTAVRGGESHSATAKLAFVCAGIALLQRAATFEPRVGRWLDSRPHHEMTVLAVPDLYDYYLLLVEVLLRRHTAEGVA